MLRSPLRLKICYIFLIAAIVLMVLAHTFPIFNKDYSPDNTHLHESFMLHLWMIKDEIFSTGKLSSLNAVHLIQLIIKNAIICIIILAPFLVSFFSRKQVLHWIASRFIILMTVWLTQSFVKLHKVNPDLMELGAWFLLAALWIESIGLLLIPRMRREHPATDDGSRPYTA